MYNESVSFQQQKLIIIKYLPVKINEWHWFLFVIDILFFLSLLFAVFVLDLSFNKCFKSTNACFISVLSVFIDERKSYHSILFNGQTVKIDRHIN